MSSKSAEWGAGFQAQIIADSVNPAGCRLVTWVLKYPRFVHAELMTHRQFSRNASSSRARPIKVMIDECLEDPAMPVYWGKNQRGMSARAELDAEAIERCKAEWLAARDEAVARVRALDAIGLHKQIANRILEPWMWITVVLSTTTHANWFALRDHPDAQPEIAVVAKMMREALEQSTAAEVPAGGWHLPFVRDSEQDLPLATRQAIATARCARVSYLTHDGERDLDKDITLHDRLRDGRPPHASPFEHAAEALPDRTRAANFVGWRQYRAQIADESAPQEFSA